MGGRLVGWTGGGRGKGLLRAGDGLRVAGKQAGRMFVHDVSGCIASGCQTRPLPTCHPPQEHPVILEFWRALATFSPQEQADFLRFVTSCPRPPLLGFRCVNRGAWGGTGHALLHDNQHGSVLLV